MSETYDSPLGVPRTVKVGARKYAFGLFWQTASSAKTVRAEARALAQRAGIDADLYVARVEPEPQFGLGRRADGLERGAYAAAAVAASAIGGSWLGVFRVGSGYWNIAVRDDIILPESDRWSDDEEVARKHFIDQLELGGWHKIFVPHSDWIAGAEELAIEDLLSASSGPRLTDVAPLAGRTRLIGLGTALALALAAAGYSLWQYTAVEEAPPIPPEAIKPVVYETPPWWLQPKPGPLLDACIGRILDAPAIVPGFAFSKAECRLAGAKPDAVVTFLRKAGTAEWFNAWFERNPVDARVSVNTAGTGTLLFALPSDLAQRRGEEPIHRASDIERAFVGLAQGANVKIALGQPRPPTPPAGQSSRTWRPPPYAPMAFTIETDIPQPWVDVIARIPGLVLAQVEMKADPQNPQTLNWSLKGDIYVRN